MFQFVKRFLGQSATAYRPGDGRIVSLAPAATSGVVVNETTALGIPAFFHALRLYGQTLGMLKWNILQIGDRHSIIARAHPVHRLLHEEPNEYQTTASFRETLIAHAIVFGNGFAFIERNGNFRPTALVPLLPDRTSYSRKNGKLVYTTLVNGRDIDLEPYQVFHLPGFGTDGIGGLPLVQLMKNTLGLAKAEEDFFSAFLANGCHFGGIAKTAGVLSPEARTNLKQSMVENHGGLANAFKVLFFEEGMDFEPVGVDPEKVQLVNARQYQLGDLARVVGLSPHLIYDLSHATFSNIEHLGIEAVTYSFGPIANKLSLEANRKLLYESEKGAFESSIDLKPLMAGDSKTQAERDQIRFNCGARTPNEMRIADGLEPLPGGDQLFVNGATMPLASLIAKIAADIAAAGGTAPSTDAAPSSTNDEPPADPSAGIAEPDGEPGPDANPEVVEDVRSAAVMLPVVIDVLGRMAQRDAKAVTNAAEKFAGDDDGFNRWLTAHTDKTRPQIMEAITPVAQTIEAMTDRSVDVEKLAVEHVAAIEQDARSYLATPQHERSTTLAALTTTWVQERVAAIANDLVGGSSQ